MLRDAGKKGRGLVFMRKKMKGVLKETVDASVIIDDARGSSFVIAWDKQTTSQCCIHHDHLCTTCILLSKDLY